MKLTNSLSDQTALRELGERLSQKRIGLAWSQVELAQRSGIAKRTLERLEAGQSVQLVNLIRVLRALDLLTTLDVLLPETGPRPMDLLKLQGKVRQRVSRKNTAPPPANWSWGDES